MSAAEDTPLPIDVSSLNLKRPRKKEPSLILSGVSEEDQTEPGGAVLTVNQAIEMIRAGAKEGAKEGGGDGWNIDPKAAKKWIAIIAAVLTVLGVTADQVAGFLLKPTDNEAKIKAVKEKVIEVDEGLKANTSAIEELTSQQTKIFDVVEPLVKEKEASQKERIEELERRLEKYEGN